MNLSKVTSSYRTKLIISVYRKWIKPNDNILDVGCGTGIVAKILKDNFQTKITGADIKKYLIYDLPFITIKSNKIPVKDESFDTAMLNDVLHHINKEYQANAIKEAMRVSKKVFIFEFEPTIIGKVADVILNKFHYGDLNAPLSVRSTEEWQKMFKDMGFKSKSVKLNRTFWYPFSHIAFMLTKR